MISKRHPDIYFAGLMYITICVETLYRVGQTTLKEADIADILSLVKVCELILCALGIPCAVLLIASAATDKTRPQLALPATVNLIALIAVNLGLAAVEGFVPSELEEAKNLVFHWIFYGCILYAVVRFYRNETKSGGGVTQEIAMDEV